jgi:orotidine-5'-phosphate decarboxylase
VIFREVKDRGCYPEGMSVNHDALCVALDGSDRRWIVHTAQTVGTVAGWLKVGLEAFVAHGPDLVQAVADGGTRVFLDLKLHDIPTTVERAARNCARSGARMFNVHAAGGPAMLEAAVAGAAAAPGQRPLVIAVTVLTSLAAADLEDLGLIEEPEKIVVRWASIAARCGLDGVVASAREAPAIRRACGPDFLIVTPGIRPQWASADDQRRVVTPADALAAGSDILVVGRPITRAEDPAGAAHRIISEMARCGPA